MTDPAGLRRSYERAELDESSLAATWHEQLLTWFSQAVTDLGDVEANAIQLATANEAGRPSVRTVLAKGIDEQGVTFFTNYESAKAHDLDVRPFASIVFLWQAHERQVRLSGPVRRVSREETEEYFATRPRGSQLGAWASPQSQVVTSRAELDGLLAAAEQRFGDGPIPAPPTWGGFRLTPFVVEFWQGRPDRLHDRLRFRVDNGVDAGFAQWVVERLAP